MDNMFVMLCLSSAVSNLLSENHGVIAQGEDENNEFQKVLIYKEKNQIRVKDMYDSDLPIGTLIIVHDTASSAILGAAEDPTSLGFVIDDD